MRLFGGLLASSFASYPGMMNLAWGMFDFKLTLFLSVFVAFVELRMECMVFEETATVCNEGLVRS
jgi:hypothetical protein